MANTSASYPIPARANAAMAAALIAGHFYVLIVLPLYLLPLNPWFGLSIIPFCFLHSMHWGLIHEAIHKHLQASRRANEYGGRLLSILLGVSFHILAFGHLMHHKLNREWQSEIVEQKNVHETVRYFFTLLGGLYLTEIASSLALALLPKKLALAIAKRNPLIAHSEVAVSGKRFFYDKGHIRALRIDMALIAALYGTAAWLYMSQLWLLALFLLSRAVMISFMDNLYHYATTMDSPGKNLSLSPWVATLLLNSNFHGTHHSNPSVPWRHLPAAHGSGTYGFHGGFLSHAWMQFAGPRLAAA